MKPISIIEAPLVVEAYWSGVSLMAQTLREAGFPERVNAIATTQPPAQIGNFTAIQRRIY